MRSIPIDVLRAFVGVVEVRGFTRAAEELGRSQPTISLQVKRLEELVEAPLFEKAARFELTRVGAVCFDYGKRLLRLHDDMLDEAARSRRPASMLRVGMPSEFAALLAARLGQLRADAQIASAFDVITDASQALATAFRENALDIALVVGAGEGDPHRIEQWRAPLLWFGGGAKTHVASQPLPLVIAPQGSPFHEQTVGALRAQGRKFDIICTSPDFAVLAAAAAAGLGITPMVASLAPKGLKPCVEKNLPALPAVRLSLLARSPALALAGRRWVANVVQALQPV
jgi:DNA-binding transcriptional LysR family regulator